MKILFLYPNAEGYQRIPLGTALLITILKKNGHHVELFDTTFLRGQSVDNSIREKANLVKKTDLKALYSTVSDEQIDAELVHTVTKVFPDIVAISIVEDNYVYADHLLGVVKSHFPRITTIAGGSLPTVAPQVVINNPHIDYVIQGEGEGSLLEFCRYIKGDLDVSKISNLWYKRGKKLLNNPLCAFVDMNDLPDPDLDQWDERHFQKPYDGKVYRAGFFEIGRGCMNVCSYCINHSCRKMLRAAGQYHRQKSVSRLISEVKSLMDRYRYEMVFFTDDDFLHLSSSELDCFDAEWTKKIHLPYWINTRPERLTKENVKRLKNTGCCGVGIGIESGNEWVRKNILKRSVSNDRLKQAFSLLHEYKIRTTANNMIGFPGEFEDHIWDTIDLVRQIKPDSCDVTFVAPYIGTDIHRVSKELGYIDIHEKPGFEGMAKNISIRRGAVIRLPQISSDRLQEIFYKFMKYVDGSELYTDSQKISHVDDRDRQVITQEVIKAMQEHSQYFSIEDGSVAEGGSE